MKKVLSLFALCAIFAFAGCAKKKGEEKPKQMKKEHVKKEKKDKSKEDKSKKDKAGKKCKSCKPKRDMAK